jgi:hypothetical protein
MPLARRCPLRAEARYTPRMEDIRRVLQTCSVVAILGATDKPSKAGYYVPEYLRGQGYRVIPVNPAKVGGVLFGEPVRASLLDIDEPVDMINIFRRSELLAGHLDEILEIPAPPRVVWLQYGVRDDEFAEALRARGIEVIQDRCTLADHRRLGLGAPTGAR